MIERLISNEIEIRCSPEQLYDYVTQPWCWHEWHPSSLSARSDVDVLHEGDHFDEHIVLRPLSPLPLALHRQTRYLVTQARRPTDFEVHGETRDGGLTIRYRLTATELGTRFRRDLTYQVRGPVQLIEPLLLYPRMKALSRVALSNLKTKLELACGQ